MYVEVPFLPGVSGGTAAVLSNPPPGKPGDRLRPPPGSPPMGEPGCWWDSLCCCCCWDGCWPLGVLLPPPPPDCLGLSPLILETGLDLEEGGWSSGWYPERGGGGWWWAAGCPPPWPGWPSLPCCAPMATTYDPGGPRRTWCPGGNELGVEMHLVAQVHLGKVRFDLSTFTLAPMLDTWLYAFNVT